MNPEARSEPGPLPPVIAIVGGIGSGKSFVARLFEEAGGVVRIDADLIGHEVLARPEVIRELAEAFGSEILDAAGQVNRKVVAAKVFGPGRELARSRLEAITHPRIRAEIERQIALVRQPASSHQSTSDRPAVRAIVLDAAILLEVGWNDLVDRIVYVDTPDDVRLRRVHETRGWSAEELRRRELSQWTLERKRSAAHDMIRNSEESGDVRRQVLRILNDAAKS